MSVNRFSEIWKGIKPFAQRWLDEIISKNKNSNTSQEGYFIILYDVDGQVKKEYSVGVDGLDGAMAAAVVGDLVWIPPCEIAGDHTLIAGTALVGFSRDASVLSGEITLTAGSRLESLSVLRAESSGSDLIAVVGPGSGKAVIRECDMEAYNCGSGNAYGLYAGAGDVECEEVKAIGESRSGDGWGVYQS